MAKDFAKDFYNSKAWLKCREGYIKSVFGQQGECGGYRASHTDVVPGKIR